MKKYQIWATVLKAAEGADAGDRTKAYVEIPVGADVLDVALIGENINVIVGGINTSIVTKHPVRVLALGQEMDVPIGEIIGKPFGKLMIQNQVLFFYAAGPWPTRGSVMSSLKGQG